MVEDINPGGDSSDPHSLTNVNGTLYFSADDGTHGYEPWILRPPTNQPPAASADGPYTADEGQTLQLDGSATSDPDEPNTALTYEWDLDYDGMTFDVDATGMQPTVSFAEDFPARSIAVRVTDSGGLDDLATTTLQVNNVAPEAVIDSIVDDGGQVIGTDTGAVLSGLDIALTGSFSDAGAVDTHTATITWGDADVTDLGAVNPSELPAHTMQARPCRSASRTYRRQELGLRLRPTRRGGRGCNPPKGRYAANRKFSTAPSQLAVGPRVRQRGCIAALRRPRHTPIQESAPPTLTSRIHYYTLRTMRYVRYERQPMIVRIGVREGTGMTWAN